MSSVGVWLVGLRRGFLCARVAGVFWVSQVGSRKMPWCNLRIWWIHWILWYSASDWLGVPCTFGLISPFSNIWRPGLLYSKWRREWAENSRRFSFIGVYFTVDWITVRSCPRKGNVDVEGAWVPSVHPCLNKFLVLLSCGYCHILHGILVCLWEGTWLPRSVGWLVVISFFGWPDPLELGFCGPTLECSSLSKHCC